MDRPELLRTGKRVATEISQKNVTFMAAGIAYNAFVSLVPLLVLLLFVTSAFGGGLEERIVALSEDALPGSIAGVVASVFEGEAGVAGASAVGAVVLLWGTLKIFRGLDTAFSEIYETVGKNSLVDQLVDGVVVLVALLVAVVSTVAATAAFAAVAETVPFAGLLTPLVLVAGLVVAFFPIYYRFPDTDVAWEHVLPGVVIAAVGWAALQALFQVYLSATGGSGGFFGGVIVVVTWLYFSGLVLLVGAVVNAVLGGYASGRSGGVGRGAADGETRREETLSREAFAEYLQGLRTELTGRHEGAAATGDGEPRRFPQPSGGVDVIEGSTREDGTREWTITFRWRTRDDEPAPESDVGDGEPETGGGDADD